MGTDYVGDIAHPGGRTIIKRTRVVGMRVSCVQCNGVITVRISRSSKKPTIYFYCSSITIWRHRLRRRYYNIVDNVGDAIISYNHHRDVLISI